ncbi:MAG: hypothetical protein E7658_00220 [Ruminococcaceae bacterium]|nr:hypothetical protein [Oscillospiraceae bacterium]
MCIIEAILVLHMSCVINAASNNSIIYDGSNVFNTLNSILANDMLSEKTQYEDFLASYAGAIIDESGKLIVYLENNVTSLSGLKEELYEKNVAVSSIQFLDVEFSYNELKAYKNVMWDFVTQTKENEINETIYLWANKLQATAIDPASNRVELYVVGFEEEDYDLCEQFFGDYPYEIEILPEEYRLQEDTTIKPGQSVTSTGGSIGFRCKLSGVEGFITATHSSTDYNVQNEVSVSIGGVVVGKITAGKYDGMSDFTFVELTNPNYDISATTNTSPAYTLNGSNYVVSLPVGYEVFMAGCKSSSVREGTVYRDGYTISQGSDWLVCDYPSQSGDSGGCIFAEVNGDYCIVGIHDGTLVGTGLDYATKLSTMRGYYDITLY